MKRLLSVLTLASSLVLGQHVTAQANDRGFSESMDKYLQSEHGQQAFGKALEGYMQRKQAEAQKKQDEMEDAQLEGQFKNPVKIDAGTSPVKGNAGARVTIIEFSDFQCPFCRRGKEAMDQVLKAYPNDVKVVFKHFPLEFHKDAAPAAKAAYAAGKQGKFWEMHDALFTNQSSLGSDFYLKKAADLGLNIDRFKQDMESEEAAKSIQADTEVGQKNGIQGTPGFFVNGVAVKGAYPFDHFKKIIDRWLAGGAK